MFTNLSDQNKHSCVVYTIKKTFLFVAPFFLPGKNPCSIVIKYNE